MIIVLTIVKGRMSMKDKKRILRIVIPVIAIACSLAFIPWSILFSWISPLPQTVQSEVENAVDLGFDGIIVYVNQPDEATFYSAGWDNRENKVLADPQALFKIASTRKIYIAVAASKLIDDQTLSLDDTLADHLPEYASRIENAAEISLRQMLQHRSGIPNFTDQADYPWSKPPKSN